MKYFNKQDSRSVDGVNRGVNIGATSQKGKGTNPFSPKEFSDFIRTASSDPKKYQEMINKGESYRVKVRPDELAPSKLLPKDSVKAKDSPQQFKALETLKNELIEAKKLPGDEASKETLKALKKFINADRVRGGVTPEAATAYGNALCLMLVKSGHDYSSQNNPANIANLLVAINSAQDHAPAITPLL